jgi:hypothetical protein
MTAFGHGRLSVFTVGKIVRTRGERGLSVPGPTSRYGYRSRVIVFFSPGGAWESLIFFGEALLEETRFPWELSWT